MTKDISKLNLQELAERYKTLADSAKKAKGELDTVKQEIERRINPLANGYGTFEREVDGVTMKIVKSKNISWDSDKLSALYQQIKEDGADPTLYIKKKEEFTVSENVYKNWSDQLKEAFDPARTEKEPKLTFEFVDAE